MPSRFAAQRRHASYYQRLAYEAEQLYLQGDHHLQSALTLFNREKKQIDEAFRVFIRHRALSQEQCADIKSNHDDVTDGRAKLLEVNRVILGFLLGLNTIADLIYYSPHERITQLTAILEAARFLSMPEFESLALRSLGAAYEHVDHYNRAIECFEQSLALDCELDNRHGEALALVGLAKIYSSLGRMQDAQKSLEKSLLIFQESGDFHNESTVLGYLGGIHRHLKNYELAIQYGNKALNVARNIGHQHIEGFALSNLGVTWREMGNYPKSLLYLEQALDIICKIGDKQTERIVLGEIGTTQGKLQNYNIAIEYHERSLLIEREIGSRKGEASSLGNLGVIYEQLNNLPLAASYYEQALDIKMEIGNFYDSEVAYRNLRRVYLVAGVNDSAYTFYTERLALSRTNGDCRNELLLLTQLILVCMLIGKRQEAVKYLHIAETLSKQEQLPVRYLAQYRTMLRLAPWQFWSSLALARLGYRILRKFKRLQRGQPEPKNGPPL